MNGAAHEQSIGRSTQRKRICSWRFGWKINVPSKIPTVVATILS
jgi:hypothetical protein